MDEENLANTPVLVDDYFEKISIFNGAEIYFLAEFEDDIKKEWKKRMICSNCFIKRILKENGVELPHFVSRIYLTPSLTELKSLLFEKSKGKMILPLDALSAVAQGQMFAHPKVSQSTDIHELMHVIMAANQRYKRNKEKIKESFAVPMWFSEGLPQYFQDKKLERNSIEFARKLEYMPPFVLKEMNIPGTDFWLEFGMMGEYKVTDNHPGLTACASFVQFLIEKQKLGLSNVWELMFSTGGIINFYKRIEDLCGQEIYVILNNFLYYVDKPFFPKDARFWEMPVTVNIDFRKKFVKEQRRYKIMNLF